MKIKEFFASANAFIKDRLFPALKSAAGGFFNKTRGLFIILGIMICCIAIMLLSVSWSVKAEVSGAVFAYDGLDSLADSGYDCILVLGAGLRDDGSPSDMLRDRISVGAMLYKSGYSKKLLMSGDHSSDAYDEVNAMKKYAIVNYGVPSSDIFMDHSGFSTYESILRAKEIFGVKKMIIVTQEYHAYRAVYIAEKLGIEAVGVSSDLYDYGGQAYRSLREIFARNKDFFCTLLKIGADEEYETIPINGNGDITNDREAWFYEGN